MAAKVGFDLYMKMLKKSIRQLRGLDLPRLPRTNVLLPEGEGSLEISIGPNGVSHSFRIPKSYIADENERSKLESAARLAESTSQLVELTNTWKDEYGPLPMTVQVRERNLFLFVSKNCFLTIL
jgi:transcription-repair coupling factor (superfamily II helicase)